MMIIVRCLAPILFAACAAATTAQEPLPSSSGQTLYLPIYPDLWHADLRNPRTVSFITVARPIRPAE